MKLKYLVCSILLLNFIRTFAQKKKEGEAFVTNVRQITADFDQIKGPKSEVFNNCTSAGGAYEGLRAEWQRQLQETVNDIGIKYIRFHGLLGDEMAFTQSMKKEKKYIISSTSTCSSTIC